MSMVTPPAQAPCAAAPAAGALWSVVCLCAQWCATCRAYQGTFATLQAQYPQWQWSWVDIEDEEEVVGEVEVDTFPTLLIAQGDTVRFMGPLVPQAVVLERLLQSLQETEGAAPVGVSASTQALWQRLQPWLAQRTC